MGKASCWTTGSAPPLQLPPQCQPACSRPCRYFAELIEIPVLIYLAGSLTTLLLLRWGHGKGFGFSMCPGAGAARGGLLHTAHLPMQQPHATRLPARHAAWPNSSAFLEHTHRMQAAGCAAVRGLQTRTRSRAGSSPEPLLTPVLAVVAHMLPPHARLKGQDCSRLSVKLVWELRCAAF